MDKVFSPVSVFNVIELEETETTFPENAIVDEVGVGAFWGAGADAAEAAEAFCASFFS